MINILIVLLGLTMLYMSATSRIRALINMLSIQGLILFSIVFLTEDNIYNLNFLILLIETLFVKAYIIPLFLKKIVVQNSIYRDTEPYIPNFYSLVISSIILFIGFIISNLHGHSFENLTTLYFGVSISTIIISLFFITTKKKIITLIIGYIMLENGIFLLSLSVAKEMPMIVNLGILLDVFIAIFILGLLTTKIKFVFEELNVCNLCNLKDCECDD